MEDRAAFVSEFKTVARRKGTSPEDLFADYDRDESGIIRFDFFRRILSSINFWVDEKRLEAITSEFIDGRNFHYADFMNTSGTQLTKRDGVTDADIAEFGRQLQARRIYLIDTLEAYDVHHFGHVSSMNFLRSFGNTPLNNKICNHFKGSTDEVDYLLLNKEIKRVLSSYGDKQTVPEPKLDSIPPYFSTIAQDIQAQGIELYPIFLGLDRFKRGTIPKLAFQKTLNGYKFHVNANQLSQVIDLFTDDQGTVPYKAFCEEIDKAIRQLPKTTKSTFAVKGDINTTLNYLRDVVKNRHCQIEDQLKACDRRNTGLIPSQRFFKALATEQYKITNQDMDVLEQEFTDGRGNIEYTRFLEAILPSTRQTTDSADKTLMRLKNFLDERKIQIRPRLQRYESDGSVSSAELLQVLRALSFDMTQRESQTLIALLAPRVNSRINLDDLCNQIDPILPVRKSAIQIEEEAAAASKTYAKPESREEPPENIEDILVGVLKFAERNGIDFQTEFRQRDSHRNGTVPRSQFQSTLILAAPGLSDAEVNLISDYYKVSQQQINYNGFLLDLDQYVIPLYESLKEHLNKPSEQHPETTNVVRRFKSLLMDQRTAPEDLFVRYDSLKCGTVLKTRLASILESLGFRLTPVEEQCLNEDFQDSRLPEMFNYRKFCQQLNEMQLTVQDLSQIRTKPINANVQDREVATLVNSIRERIQERRKRVREPFSDFQPGAGIPSSDFRRALNSFGLVIKENDILKILKYYRFNRQGDVDWDSFCNDVETSKTVQF